MSKFNNWVFTLNNPTEEDIDSLRALKTNYIVYGRETAPTTGTPHLQGFFVLQSRKTRTALKKYLPRFWFDPKSKDSTFQEAINYCKKGGDFSEDGLAPKELGSEGNSDRWTLARILAQEGKFQDIPSDIYLRCRNSIHAIRVDYEQKMGRDEVLTLDSLWIWGPPGVGKSRYARDSYPDAYVKNPNKWFCGYDTDLNPAVLIDDLDKTHACLAYYLKIWGDRYPFRAETKGSSIYIRPPLFIVTSNYSPEEIFEDTVTVTAIRRRYKIVHMENPFAKI